MCPRSFVSTAMPTPHPPWSGPTRSVAGTADVGQEHLVELGPARHLAERSHLDAGGAHVEEEERDALVPRRVGIGPGHEDAPVADPPAGAPHLLTVDDETVAVLFSAGGERGQVAAGTGLGEQLAPHLLAPQGRAQVALALLRRAEAQDAAAGQHQTDHVEHRRHAGGGALLDPGRGVLDGQPAAAVLDRPVQPGPAGLGQAPLPRPPGVDQLGRADGAVVAGRVMGVGGQPGARLEAQLLDVHLRRRVRGGGQAGSSAM